MKYTGRDQYVVFNITTPSPFDVRTVVSASSDLMSAEGWGEFISDIDEWNLYIYKGIVVSVVDDPDVSKNGLYVLQKDINDIQIDADGHFTELFDEVWKKIGDGTSLPDYPSDKTKSYNLVYEDGQLKWEESQGGSGKTSEVMALKPTYSDDGTVTYEGMRSTKLEHLTSQYREKSGGEPKTADVIAVQNTDEAAKTTSFHLMINPQILMVMNGGGAESKERVLIMCDNYFETASVEGNFGVHYLYEEHMFATNPSDATTTWYSDSACTISLGTGDNENPGTYIPAGTTGTLVLYAIARKDGYIDSYKHKIEFVRTSDKISVRVTVQDVTRTNGQTKIAVQHEEEAR